MHISKIFVFCIVPLLLSGCAGLFRSERPITVQTQVVERTPLAIDLPAPLQPRVTRWIIITPDNAESVWQDLRDRKMDLVLFAVTDNGYEEMAMTQAEIRNLIRLQREIILKYQEYYEPRKDTKSGK